MKESDVLLRITILHHTPVFLHGLFLYPKITNRLERDKKMKINKITNVRRLAITAMLGAVASILMLFEFPMPFIVPSFIKMDFSDLPALIASFVVSPISGVMVCLIKNVVHIATSMSAGAGELANFILSASLCLTSGYIYKLRKTRVIALLACLEGSLITGLISIPVNLYITYPFYMNAMGYPLEAIMGAYNEINPAFAIDLFGCLTWFNMPFTILKGIAISLITFVIYKPLSNALKGFMSNDYSRKKKAKKTNSEA